ncbi:hypothetical protein HK405_013718 [Cladochytrium tenue]|nr:hypothetical protein HK405_013718 [Cladochytrium tenue]
MQGSIPWMAPEVARAKGYSAKVDIWSLGCLVLEMLTGNPPWFKVSGSVIYMLGSGKPPPIPDGISSLARGFLELCFAINPDQRPRAEDLLEHPFASVGDLDFDFKTWVASLEAKKLLEQDEDDDEEDDDDYDDDDDESDDSTDSVSDSSDTGAARDSDGTAVRTASVGFLGEEEGEDGDSIAEVVEVEDSDAGETTFALNLVPSAGGANLFLNGAVDEAAGKQTPPPPPPRIRTSWAATGEPDTDAAVYLNDDT